MGVTGQRAVKALVKPLVKPDGLTTFIPHAPDPSLRGVGENTAVEL